MAAETASTPDSAGDLAEPSPWKDREFLIFATGNTINNLGEAIYAVALPLLVYDLTGSLGMMSILAAIIPASLLLGPWLGFVVDRWGARVMVVPGLLLQFVAALGLNLIGLSDGASVWLVFGFAVLIQLGGVWYQTGWMAGVVLMFPSNPGRARGSLSSLFVASRIIGVSFFSVTLPHIGYLGLLWINLATYLAPIIVWYLGIRPRPFDPEEIRAKRRVLPDLVEGWRILRGNKIVANAMVIALPLSFVTSVGTVTLVIFDLRNNWHLSSSRVGTVLTVCGVGGLIGTLVVSQRRKLVFRASFLTITVGVVVSMLAMAAHVLPVLIAAVVLMYGLQGAFAVTSQMMIFKLLPAKAIGRASGFLNLITGIPMLIAPLVIPSISGAVGVEYTFAILGAVAFLAFLHLVRSWPKWKLNEPSPTLGAT